MSGSAVKEPGPEPRPLVLDLLYPLLAYILTEISRETLFSVKLDGTASLCLERTFSYLRVK